MGQSKCAIEFCKEGLENDGIWPLCNAHLIIYSESYEQRRADYYDVISDLWPTPQARTAEADFVRRLEAEKRNGS